MTAVIGSVNSEIAARLDEMADLLAAQEANPFRVSAYRKAASAVRNLPESVSDVYEAGGRPALVALPAIGEGIAGAIAEILSTGKWNRLERLRGECAPEQLFASVPGIGPELANRIHEHLDVDTLEELEVAAHDGRLEGVPGVGPRRAEAVRASLQAMLGRRARQRHREFAGPPAAEILRVDREYREKAEAGNLLKIAPKRFNPMKKAWLPVLHTQIGPWHYTALYSNTARAHELRKTRDWVVVYFYDEGHREGQHTVVTETQGALKGERVVRGRERECYAHYGMRRG